MLIESQDGATGLDAALAAALEAAADRVGQRAEAVIMTARLATAMHMKRAAEHARGDAGKADGTFGTGHPAATDSVPVAATFMREGGRR